MKALALLFASMAVGLGSASVASATDYIVGGGSGGDTDAFFRISTDGKLGLLSYLDITDVVALATPNYPAIYSGAQLQGDVLTATSTALFYNFDATPPGHLLLAAFLPGDIDSRFADYGDFSDNGEYFAGPGGGANDVISIPNLHGIQQISVSAAPEPCSWLLMCAGIGSIGLMLRRAKQTMGFRFKDALSA